MRVRVLLPSPSADTEDARSMLMKAIMSRIILSSKWTEVLLIVPHLASMYPPTALLIHFIYAKSLIVRNSSH